MSGEQVEQPRKASQPSIQNGGESGSVDVTPLPVSSLSAELASSGDSLASDQGLELALGDDQLQSEAPVVPARPRHVVQRQIAGIKKELEAIRARGVLLNPTTGLPDSVANRALLDQSGVDIAQRTAELARLRNELDFAPDVRVSGGKSGIPLLDGFKKLFR